MGVWGAWGPHICPPCPPLQVQLINDAYNAVVDAVLGAEAELGEGRGPCAGILATLKHVRIPIVSLDVPSGMGTPRVGFPPYLPLRKVSSPSAGGVGTALGPPTVPSSAASPRFPLSAADG